MEHAGTAGDRTKAATFVLVHGAWHGGWCWQWLTPRLRAAGHAVVAPTLTGLGERAHLLTPEVDLDTHIRDITALLEYDDLERVVLVGHSYGGMVIAGVAAQVPERVIGLVYLDAFLPEDGRAVADYCTLAPTGPDGWRVPPPASASGFGITDVRAQAWVDARLGDQPLKTFTQPVRLGKPSGAPVATTFILCSEAPWFVEAAERAKRRGFGYQALLSAGHDAMVTQPAALSGMLLNAVA